MLAEILTTIAPSLVSVGALYWFWGRPLSRQLVALKEEFRRALPASLDELDLALTEKIAQLDADDDSSADEDGEVTKKPPQVRRIPPPDPGIPSSQIDRKMALALAKQEILLGRNRESLPPKMADLKWPPGTVFKDKWDAIFVVTSGLPICLYRHGRGLEGHVAKEPLTMFRGGHVDLLVTVDEMRACSLLS